MNAKKTDKFKSNSAQLEKLHQQINELMQALQQERADSVNLRRRHEEQSASLRDVMKASVVRELLPALDDLERALNHTPGEIAGSDYAKGVQAVAKRFAKALEAIGVERIKTAGEEFDPKYHEAVSMDGGEGTKEVVSEELQPGYKLGEEVIRHAMVKVKLS